MPMIKGLQAGGAFAVVVLVAGLGVISGCGGDDESTAGTSGPVAATEDGGGSAAGNGDGESSGAGADGEAAEGSGRTAGSVGAEGSGSTGGGADGAGGANGGAKGQSGKSGLGGGTARGRSARKKGSSGGGGSEGGTVTGSDSAFFEQADAICREAEANTRENLNEYLDGKGFEAIGDASKAIVNELVIPGLEKTMRDITALNPPASASGAITALFASYEKVIGAAKANPEQLILQGDVAVQSEEEAKQSGFQVCGGI